MADWSMADKAEWQTHLYGAKLADKDHPVIVFRGKLDGLCSAVLEAQLLGERAGDGEFVSDLQEVLAFVRAIQPAEYRGIPLGEFRLLGMDAAELRERSHHPEKYFGQGHILMDRSAGALSCRANLLRTMTRELELSAVTAFRNPEDTAASLRPDILRALNRLSSLFYVMIYKYLPEGFVPVGDAGI